MAGDTRFGGGAAMAQPPGAGLGLGRGGFIEFLRRNPAALLQIGGAIGSTPNWSAALGQIGQAVPPALAFDRENREKQRQRAAVTAFLKSKQFGTAIPPEALGVFEEFPELAVKYGLDRMLPKPKEYDFREVDGSLFRTDPTTGTAESIYTAPPDTFRPLTDPTERLKFGIPQSDKAPYQVGPDNKVYAVGGGGTNVTVDLSPKTPGGFMPVDPSDLSKGVVPIPGGPATQMPAELAARVGLAKEFLRQLPDLKAGIKAGTATGPVDVMQGKIGWGESGEIHRRMKSGTDALRRMLTGAGMPAAEASEYVRRYEPTFTDDAAILTDKVEQLEVELQSIIDEATRGRGVTPEAPRPAPPPGSALPPPTMQDIEAEMRRRGLL
jgi:hypothetical protein